MEAEGPQKGMRLGATVHLLAQTITVSGPVILLRIWMKPNFGGLNYHKVPRLSSLLCMLRSLSSICPNIDIVNNESSNGARIHVGWKVVLSQNDVLNSCTMRKKYVSTLWNTNLDVHPFSSLTTLKTGRPGTPDESRHFPVSFGRISGHQTHTRPHRHYKWPSV